MIYPSPLVREQRQHTIAHRATSTAQPRHLTGEGAMAAHDSFVSVDFIYTLQTQVQFVSMGNEALQTLGKSFDWCGFTFPEDDEALRTLGKEF